GPPGLSVPMGEQRNLPPFPAGGRGEHWRGEGCAGLSQGVCFLVARDIEVARDPSYLRRDGNAGLGPYCLFHGLAVHGPGNPCMEALGGGVVVQKDLHFGSVDSPKEPVGFVHAFQGAPDFCVIDLSLSADGPEAAPLESSSII